MKCLNIIFLICFLCIATSNTLSQNLSLQVVDTFALKADKFVGIDKFNNLYHISNNTLFKTSDTGESIAFKDVILGDIDRVDILNPNKIIVFYKMSNTIVILDNRMTEIDRQDFNRVTPFKNVGFAGTSKDQGVWIYNIDLNQLELYDYRYGRSLAVSLPIDDEILSIKNNFNYCFLETEDGISIFNIYGSLVKKIYFTDIKAFDLYKNRLIVYSNGELKLFNEDFELKNSMSFTADDFKNFFYKDENLYLYDGKNLSRYSILKN